MSEIAKEASVTVSTVSRALSNDGSISDAVRKRILGIAHKHNYRKKRTSGVIAYVIDKRYFLMTSHFYNPIMEGIEERIKLKSYTFQFYSLDSQQFSAASISTQKLAGMIVTSSYHDDFIREIKELGIPIVLLDYYLPTERIDSILIDNIDGIVAGMDYLRSLGHRRIAYLPGDMSEIGCEDRLTGYRRAVRWFSLADEPQLVIPSDFNIQSSFQAMQGFLHGARTPPTAVVAVNDMVAIGAMEAIKERGLRIPEDVSVLGFDDIDLADQVRPRLSTMRVNKRLMGALAVDRLLEIIRGENSEFSKLLIKPTMTVRESTGPAREGTPAGE